MTRLEIIEIRNVAIIVGILLLLPLLHGCSPYNIQNQWRVNISEEGIIESADNTMFEILDIRDEPLYIQFGLPRQPEVLAHTIMNFRGYDSQFKFDNMLAIQQGKPELLWCPYWGAK